MAYANQSDRSPAGAASWQRLGDLRADLAARLAQYRVYRATLSELAMLSDRDLTDLGIHRGDIRGIAHEAAYRA